METDKAKIISVKELFSQSWVIYKKVFKRAIGLQFFSLLGFVPLVIVLVLFAILRVFASSGNVLIGVVNVILGLLGVLSLPLVIFFSVMAYCGVYKVIAAYDQPITFREALVYGKKNFWSFLWLGLLTVILITLWTLLLIIPGIIMGVFYSFAVWLYIKEKVYGMDALRRSKELVRGYWWPVFGRSLVLFIVAWALSSLLGMLINDRSVEKRTYSLVNQVFSIFFTPFFLAYSYGMFQSLYNIKNQPKI